jgi:hypothetical protein
MYKFLEEQDLKEIEQEEGNAEANDVVDRIGFDQLTGVVKKCVDDGAEIVKEFQSLRTEIPDDHYFKSFAWPSSETYEVKANNFPEGGFIDLVADNARIYNGRH